MSRTRKAPHKPRCGMCHPNKLDGNSLKNANRAERLQRDDAWEIKQSEAGALQPHDDCPYCLGLREED